MVRWFDGSRKHPPRTRYLGHALRTGTETRHCVGAASVACKVRVASTYNAKPTIFLDSTITSYCVDPTPTIFPSARVREFHQRDLVFLFIQPLSHFFSLSPDTTVTLIHLLIARDHTTVTPKRYAVALAAVQSGHFFPLSPRPPPPPPPTTAAR